MTRMAEYMAAHVLQGDPQKRKPGRPRKERPANEHNHEKREPTVIRNPRNRPHCPACDCPDLDTDTGKCDCTFHQDCDWGYNRDRP